MHFGKPDSHPGTSLQAACSFVRLAELSVGWMAARASWSAVAPVLQAATEPANRMNRVLFEVRSDDGPGCFACYMPLDRGLDFETGFSRSVGISPGVGLEEVLRSLERLIVAGISPAVWALLRPPEEGISVWDGEEAHNWVPLDRAAPKTDLPVGRAEGLVGITEFPRVEEPIFMDPDLYRDGDDEDSPFEERQSD